MTGLVAALAAVIVMATGCGAGQNYAENLDEPPTAGVPTQGPGSGETLAAHLHYTLQKNNPKTRFSDASCPDVQDSKPGATVTCEIMAGQEERKFLLRLDNDGIWQISDR